MKLKILSILFIAAIIPTLSFADSLPGHYCGFNIGQDLSPSVVPQNYEFVSELHQLDIELEKHGDLSKSWSWTAPKGCKQRIQYLYPQVRAYYENSSAARHATFSGKRIKNANKILETAADNGDITPLEAELISQLLDVRKTYCIEQTLEAFANIKSAQSGGKGKRQRAQERKNKTIKGCTELKNDIKVFFLNTFDEEI